MQKPNALRAYRQRHKIDSDVMAKRLGVAPSTLRSYENGNREIPAEVAVKAEKVTKGEVHRSELRSDLFLPPAQGAQAAAA